MTLHWPQITWITLALMSLGSELAKHGQPQTGRHRFGLSLVCTAGMAAVLYAGGFFG